MAVVHSKGLVHQVTLFSVGSQRGGCAWVGPTEYDSEILLILTEDSDPDPQRQQNISMLNAFTTALAGRLSVSVEHDSGIVELVYFNLVGF